MCAGGSLIYNSIFSINLSVYSLYGVACMPFSYLWQVDAPEMVANQPTQPMYVVGSINNGHVKIEHAHR